MSTSWKLEVNFEPPRFALIIGDIHLPYFSAQEAREIVYCLEGAGHINPPVLVVRDGGNFEIFTGHRWRND